MSRADVAIVGGGALGLCLAAELGARGAAVTVIDAGGPPSASAVAAGMLAPAFEAALDPAAAGGPELGRATRDLWPGLAARLGLPLHRAGAEWRGPDGEALGQRMRAAGFDAEMRAGRLFTPEDWWLQPGPALRALAAAPGVTPAQGRVARIAPGPDGVRLTLEDGGVLEAAAAVLAGGAAGPPEGAGWTAPVRPVKGQIARLDGWSPPRVLRGPGVYVVPAPGGAIVGATMEPGRDDLEVEPAAIESLLARARAMAAELEDARLTEARAGVRGESPDGLPLAGRVGPRLGVALAPRRNGWLLAPLVARVAADALEGRGPGPFAAAMDPARFDRP